MKNKLGWILAALFGVLLLIFAGAVLVFGRMWRFGAFGTFGRPYGMMERGHFFFQPLGWVGMALMWLIPIGILVLIVAGVVGLVSAFTGSNKPSSTSTAPMTPVVTPPPAVPENTRTCQNCGKPVQDDWKHCPNCGQELT